MRRMQAAVGCMTALFLTACALSSADPVESLVETTGIAEEEAGINRVREQGAEQAEAGDTERTGAQEAEQAETGDTERTGAREAEQAEALAETENREMSHSGIYVHVQTEDQWERCWYPNETDFVTASGFEGAEPFFVYSVPDGQKLLTLYYDEVTQRGCGIRYYERDPGTFTATGMYGFVFEGLEESEESGILEDYLKPESFDGFDGSGEVEEFKENTEYDDRGRITHYDATGILTFLSEDNTKPDTVLWIDYEYYDNGNLKSRSYYHNGYIFGTWYTTWNCYFDTQGRIAYEDIYITHGSWDTYYIYRDDTKEPAYILDLDNNSGEWIPRFRKNK